MADVERIFSLKRLTVHRLCKAGKIRSYGVRTCSGQRSRIRLIDLGVGEPDEMAFPEIVERYGREADRALRRGHRLDAREQAVGAGRCGHDDVVAGAGAA